VDDAETTHAAAAPMNTAVKIPRVVMIHISTLPFGAFPVAAF
jgi:hypothetical protein